MTNDFHPDFAAAIVELFTDDITITAESPYYVTLYDDAGNELDGSLANGRVEVGQLDWTRTNTSFENAAEINFGEATADITVQEFAIKADDLADGDTTVYFKTAITDAPQDFADGTRVFYDAGELDADILD